MAGRSAGVLSWPGFSSAYARLAPHLDETVTGPRQVGVAFSGHRDVRARSGRRQGRFSYGGGSVICSGAEPIVWSEVSDPTEALEIYPTAALMASVTPAPGSHWPIERTVIGQADPVVLSVAGILRRAHVSSAYVSETAGGLLAAVLARHLVVEYGGLRLPPPPGHTRLTRGQLGVVAALVDDDLPGPLTLDRLAATVHLSAYHFARAFKATTGQPPHAYVTARRMERARHLLTSTALTVPEIAAAVGIANLSHFRRVFRAHLGAGPGAYRGAAA